MVFKKIFKHYLYAVKHQETAQGKPLKTSLEENIQQVKVAQGKPLKISLEENIQQVKAALGEAEISSSGKFRLEKKGNLNQGLSTPKDW